jgi:hypothetical protein
VLLGEHFDERARLARIAARRRAGRPEAARTASSTFWPGPSGFSLLERTMSGVLAAAGVWASTTENRLPSRPRAPIQEPVIAPAAPMPTV